MLSYLACDVPSGWLYVSPVPSLLVTWLLLKTSFKIHRRKRKFAGEEGWAGSNGLWHKGEKKKENAYLPTYYRAKRGWFRVGG